MAKYTDFDVRMKRYEGVSRKHLMTKTPVILRIDGKAFHTFTKGMLRPFDGILNKTMRLTALELCKRIQGSRFAYTQSDEISIVLIDTATIDTQAFFDYNVQKVCSIVASMATLIFNRTFRSLVLNELSGLHPDSEKDYARYITKFDEAMFDCRCFNIPDSEVVNYFVWRQKDCTRNSIQMVGRSYFSHSELNKVSTNQIQYKLLTEKDVNWNTFKTIFKRGTGIKKVLIDGGTRTTFVIDEEIPIFTEDRDYIQNMVV